MATQIRGHGDQGKSTKEESVTTTTDGNKVGLDVNVVSSSPIPVGASTEAKQDTQITEIQNSNELLGAKLVKEPFNDVEVTAKNATGAPLTILYRNDTTLIATVTITYDVDGDIQRVQVT